MQVRQNNQPGQEFFRLPLKGPSPELLAKMSEIEEVSFGINIPLLKLIESLSRSKKTASATITFKIAHDFLNDVKEYAAERGLEIITNKIDFSNVALAFPSFTKLSRGARSLYTPKAAVIVLDATDEIYKQKENGFLDNKKKSLALEIDIKFLIDSLPDNVKRVNLMFSVCVESNRTLSTSFDPFALINAAQKKSKNAQESANKNLQEEVDRLHEKIRRDAELQEEKNNTYAVQLNSLKEALLESQNNQKKMEAERKELEEKLATAQNDFSMIFNEDELSFETDTTIHSEGSTMKEKEINSLVAEKDTSTQAAIYLRLLSTENFLRAHDEKIKGQDERINQQDAKNASLKRKLEELKSELNELKAENQKQNAKIKALTSQLEGPKQKRQKRGSPSLFDESSVALLKPQQPNASAYNPNNYRK